MMTPDKLGPIMTIVVAVAENGVIGRNGALAWRISDDLKWFRRMTVGKPLIMGRKTFDSIGRALPDRDNIVITRQKGRAIAGAFTVSSFERACELARDLAAARGAIEICVIGGAEVYQQALPLADRCYLTQVCASVDGDVHFPPVDPGAWRKVLVGRAVKGPRNEFDAQFLVCDRLG